MKFGSPFLFNTGLVARVHIAHLLQVVPYVLPEQGVLLCCHHKVHKCQLIQQKFSDICRSVGLAVEIQLYEVVVGGVYSVVGGITLQEPDGAVLFTGRGSGVGVDVKLVPAKTLVVVEESGVGEFVEDRLFVDVKLGIDIVDCGERGDGSDHAEDKQCIYHVIIG